MKRKEGDGKKSDEIRNMETKGRVKGEKDRQGKAKEKGRKGWVR